MSKWTAALIVTLVAVVSMQTTAHGQEKEAGQENDKELKKKSTKPSHHDFLQKFVGKWQCVNEAVIEPGKPPVKFASRMSGQMMGKFWVVIHIETDGPGEAFEGRGLFGYDSRTAKHFVGAWGDSSSGHLWRYKGQLTGNKLVMNSEGPNPADPGQMIKARDIWEFKNKNLLLLTTEMEGPDGKYKVMMTATCTRQQ